MQKSRVKGSTNSALNFNVSKKNITGIGFLDILCMKMILWYETANIVAMKLKFDWIKFSGFFQTLDLGRVQEKDKNLKSLQEILETYAAYMIIIGARKMDKS